ncbi:sulfite exporter TauE/SafE family protein [Saliterribacillus persicus]|uniref:Probable membrane transporter protein n=1 Tax=Saliterribacillus persicus TaxID=930114 RepID=A0A368XG53_9BACI|nr:sulfite exporter TauE/SafE family protein [Saliterribacillus persicus]RCW66970.1 hypothetical protein DFR57_10866 [Saliterribacillus persicus]
MTVIFLCVFIGLLSAFMGSIVGFGGGVILVPILLILHSTVDAFEWATPNTIVGISLIIMIFTAMSSTYTYGKRGRIDIKSGFLFVAGSIPGGIFGAWANQFVTTDLFSLFLGLFMLAIFSMFFIKKDGDIRKSSYTGKFALYREKKIGMEDFHYSYSVIAAILVSFSVGSLSGFFGIGGGSLMVPVMILLFGFPAHIATATSMFMILFLSISSSSTHIFLGHVEWQYVWAFIPGAWFGGILGARVNQMMSSKAVEFMLRTILFLIALRLIWQGLG